jgi:hypothetical protein
VVDETIVLYATNVIAIVLAAIVVLVVTDFMESPSLHDPKVVVSGVAIAVLAVGIFVPVWHNSRNLDRETTFVHQAESAVLEWDLAHPMHRTVGQQIDADHVSLVIAGPTPPPGLAILRAALATDDFPAPDFEGEWTSSATIEVGSTEE